MIKILKKKNEFGETLYEPLTPPINTTPENEYETILYPLQHDSASMSFDIWYDRYKHDIQTIIDDYFRFVAEKCFEYNYICSFNTDEIRRQMLIVLYKTSRNRLKAKQYLFHDSL